MEVKCLKNRVPLFFGLITKAGHHDISVLSAKRCLCKNVQCDSLQISIFCKICSETDTIWFSFQELEERRKHFPDQFAADFKYL